MDIDKLIIHIEFSLLIIGVLVSQVVLKTNKIEHMTLIILTLLAFVVILSNNDAFAQTLHDQKLNNVVNKTDILAPQILTGIYPINIITDDEDEFTSFSQKVYVANYGSNTVSVISTEDNTKIADIPVGEGPHSMAIDAIELSATQLKKNLYVANSESNTVSVISTEDNTKIPDIAVGEGPTDLNVDYDSNILYVSNQFSDYVSVISTENNTIIKNISKLFDPSLITIAQHPNPIAFAEGEEMETDKLFILHNLSNTISVIDTENYNKRKDISIEFANFMILDSFSDVLWVSHPFNNSVSAISTKNYTKIADIPVGQNPISMALEHDTNTLYVSNLKSSDISVISTENFSKKIEDIQVGQFPIYISDPIGDNYNKIYVTHRDSNIVSVISTEDNTKIADIPVGKNPRGIAFDFYSDAVYIANEGSGGISVIDDVANEVVAKTKFQIHPFNSGSIECNGLISPSTQYFYVSSGTNCIAQPNKGFEFLSWEENLMSNSTQIINVSKPASIMESIKDFFNIKSEEPEAKLKITKFGTFTANFKELPAPVPPEFWLQSYVLVGTVIAGLSIPSIVGWIKSKMDARKLNYYHNKIASLYGDDRQLDENDIEPLNRLRNSILDAYSKGKLNEKHYESLINETSLLYKKIFRNRINDSLNNNNYASNKKTTEKQLAEIRNEIEYAYSEGKLNEKHYTNLVNNISMLYQEVFKKEIDSLNSLTNNEDKIKLLNTVLSDIEDAYSKEKVTEKHYNLLKEKIAELENTNNKNSNNIK